MTMPHPPSGDAETTPLPVRGDAATAPLPTSGTTAPLPTSGDAATTPLPTMSDGAVNPPQQRAMRGGHASARTQAAALPIAAVLLVAAVLGVQRAYGGGAFVPARAADPCAVRSASSASTGIEALGERLVLLGLDGAACRLGVTREALVLQLAQGGEPTDAQIAALRAGLLDAVDRMDADGTLPKASTLVDDALSGADLPSLVKIGIRALPDSVIDAGLKTDDVLRRTIDGLDLRALLQNLDDPGALNSQLNAAVAAAVRASLIARLRSLLP